MRKKRSDPAPSHGALGSASLRGYCHSSHCLGLATVHLCWIPKRRKSVLVDKIRDRLAAIIYQVAVDKKWFIRSLEVAPDHVHLLVEYDNSQYFTYGFSRYTTFPPRSKETGSLSNVPHVEKLT